MSGGRVVLWNALTGKEQESFKAQPDAVHIVAFSPDNRVLLSAGLDGTMTQWEMNKGVGNMKILVPE